MRIYLYKMAFILLSACMLPELSAQPEPKHNLNFGKLPAAWNQAIPLGNGIIGALVWQKNGKLRIAIDRADLWDLRPTAEIQKFTYQWAYEHRLSGDWDTVWKVADQPYDRDAGPTKLPGAAIEFDISKLGDVQSAVLDISTATCRIRWKNQVSFTIFVNANVQQISYLWSGATIQPSLIAPPYQLSQNTSPGDPAVEAYGLYRLGYPEGKITASGRVIVYDQQAWGPLRYQVAVASKKHRGVISITAHYNDRPPMAAAAEIVKRAIRKSFSKASIVHQQWWSAYWAKSSIHIPDAQLEKQWYQEIYKFGAASRKGAPPVSLQAVWTADNGLLPPWKGDFHSDLNTQLSYWPAYSSNHLDEGSALTDWLWENKPYFESYTKRVFGTSGLNVPGAATLRGREMGGWHMYAMSPTVSCWLAQHFYWQWRYSMDRSFLTEKAYPWVSAAAKHIEQLTQSANGSRKLLMSSSPEFNDGGIAAWFTEMTNYDRALTKYIFRIAAEMAEAAANTNESEHWKQVGGLLPGFDIDPSEGLTVAPGFPLHESHRHFSHMLAFHPLALLDASDAADRQVINNSLANIEKYGTSAWCGYSFCWIANMYARVGDGAKAAAALRKFVSCYCSPNSFHLNNDQCRYAQGQVSNDPFTLEGNFAFAAAVQEMLMQNSSRTIQLFPALPPEWKDVSFENLRAEGAFLLSATMKNGYTLSFTIKAPAGGTAAIKLPFRTFVISKQEKLKNQSVAGNMLTLEFEPGGMAVIENGYE